MNRVQISGFLRDFERSLELKFRLWVIFLVAAFIFLPDLFGLILLLDNAFADGPINDPITLIFKAIIVAIVFVFGVMIVAAAAHQQRWLSYSLPAIGFFLVMIAVGLTVRVSNDCIPDLGCSQDKFSLAMFVITILSALAIPLTLPNQKSAKLLAIPYLLIAFWQALLLLYIVITSTKIVLDHNYVQMLLLFISSIIWIFVYLFSSEARYDLDE